MAILTKYFFAALMIVVVCSSCQPSKKTHQQRLYLQGMDSSQLSAVITTEQKIQKADKLTIIIYSDDANASSFYNLGQGVGNMSASGVADMGATAGSNAGSYMVDGEGNILIPRLGPVYVDGLTKAALQKLLKDKLDTLLKHPYAEIRFLNKRVTMLGEVAKPGLINMPEERLTILDAIALSGDLTGFARNDNIMVVREENGKRSVGRLNIKDPAVYKSDFFYLQKNDLVYIEPVRKKPTGTDQTLIRNISLAASLISVLAILYSVFRNN